jgi:pyridoxine 4-dehydrogenase
VPTDLPAHQSGTFAIGGKTVHRLGFGAMRITGPGIWGEPSDRAEAVAVLRRAVELGVDFIDTADSYGPAVSEEIIAEALVPYPDQLLIATKAGLVRTGPDEWYPVGRPKYLRQQAEMSLRRLKLDRIDLFQLHRVDSEVPLADQVAELKALQDEGKVGAIGLSEVSIDQLKAAREIAEIATVQNLYNLTNRSSEPVLEYAAAEGIGFIPVVSDRCRRVGPTRGSGGQGRAGDRGDAVSGRIGLAAGEVAGNAANSGYFPRCTPRGECRRCRSHADRRTDRRPHRSLRRPCDARY